MGENQKAFEEIKKDISNPPVFILQNNKGHFILVADAGGVALQLYIKNKEVR